ncbi:MAG TPA: prolipoprotein diacylglyceryl transferase [bacterium]|jgi:phosphatidylglycerol:prolipoprotein diacylglycerol transferase|nr:prolipoprotein diacylglyceryl transferase [bacterium]
MHPILFTLGPLTLRTYGAMMALSFLLGVALSLHFNRREGRPDDDLLDLAVVIMLSAVAGARILYVIVEWPEFAPNPWTVVAVWQGGLVYYGGLIGACIGGAVHMVRKKLPLWSYADALAPGLALGQVTGRLGCFFNGCCYGREDARYGLIFPGIGDNIPHLPTMLYESAFCLLLCGFLVWLWGRKRYSGQVFGAYIVLYAAWRFGIEFLRGDPERGTLISSALSPSQWISLLGLALGCWLLRRRSAAKAA